MSPPISRDPASDTDPDPDDAESSHMSSLEASDFLEEPESDPAV